MIELTGQDGQKVGINPAAIWHIRRGSGEQTAIYAVTGSAIFVLEPYAEVLARCREQLSVGAIDRPLPPEAVRQAISEGDSHVDQHE